MKSLEQIIKQKPVFLNEFKSRFAVIAEFENVYIDKSEYYDESHTNNPYWTAKEDMKAALEKHEGENILFASYGAENYEGDAWVLFEEDGKLYEVNGSHCSCYGLEEQWEPEEVLLTELENRLVNGTLGEDDYSGNTFKEEFAEFLGIEVQG